MATGLDHLFGELRKPTCSLHGLAISVGNLFYHFEQTYRSDPVAFAKQYPNLTPSIAAGQVPWGKAPFPSAPVASYTKSGKFARSCSTDCVDWAR